jgi:hypothetical protein
VDGKFGVHAIPEEGLGPANRGGLPGIVDVAQGRVGAADAATAAAAASIGCGAAG